MLKAIVVLASITVITACDQENITESTLNNIVVRTTKAVYAPGEQVKFNLVNASGRSVFLNRCVGNLEFQEGTTWRLISSRGCIPEMIVSVWRDFDSGQIVPDSQATASVYPKGEYRMTFNVRVDTIGAPPFEANVSSNLFRLD